MTFKGFRKKKLANILEAITLSESVLITVIEKDMNRDDRDKSEDFYEGMRTLAYALGYSYEVDENGKYHFARFGGDLPSKNVNRLRNIAKPYAEKLLGEGSEE